MHLMVKGEASMESRILVVDDEENIRYTFDNFLSNEGYLVETASTLQDCKTLLETREFDLVFLDILLGSESGLDILRDVKEKGLKCLVVMVTGAPDVETAAEAVRYGAFDYIPKPVQQHNLLRIARAALEHKRLLEEKETFRMRLEGLFRCATEGIIITDKKMCVAEMNVAAKRLFNCDESVVGKRLDEISESSASCSLQKFADIIKARFEGEIYRAEQEDGRFLSFTAAPLITEDGDDYGYLLVVRQESA
jgi:FixJ family two-component response regulator